MSKAMKEAEILREVRKYFGKNRRKLKTALKKIVGELKEYDKWWDIKKMLHRETDQPVAVWTGLSEQTLEALDEARKNPPIIGDPSFRYEIVLNEAATSGKDWDRRLAESLGGSVDLCVIWISAILPVYAIETYTLGYSAKGNYYEYKPHTPKNAYQKDVVKKIKAELKKRDLTPVSKKLAMKTLRNVYPGENDTGSATVFECLFSDIFGYQEKWIRVGDKEFDDPVEGVKVTWRQELTRTGNPRETEIIRIYPSGDNVITITDSKKRVKEVRVLPESGKFSDKTLVLEVDPSKKKSAKKKKSSSKKKKSTSKTKKSRGKKKKK